MPVALLLRNRSEGGVRALRRLRLTQAPPRPAPLRRPAPPLTSSILRRSAASSSFCALSTRCLTASRASALRAGAAWLRLRCRLRRETEADATARARGPQDPAISVAPGKHQRGPGLEQNSPGSGRARRPLPFPGRLTGSFGSSSLGGTCGPGESALSPSAAAREPYNSAERRSPRTCAPARAVRADARRGSRSPPPARAPAPPALASAGGRRGCPSAAAAAAPAPRPWLAATVRRPWHSWDPNCGWRHNG